MNSISSGFGPGHSPVYQSASGQPSAQAPRFAALSDKVQSDSLEADAVRKQIYNLTADKMAESWGKGSDVVTHAVSKFPLLALAWSRIKRAAAFAAAGPSIVNIKALTEMQQRKERSWDRTVYGQVAEFLTDIFLRSLVKNTPAGSAVYSRSDLTDLWRKDHRLAALAEEAGLSETETEQGLALVRDIVMDSLVFRQPQRISYDRKPYVISLQNQRLKVDAG